MPLYNGMAYQETSCPNWTLRITISDGPAAEGWRHGDARSPWRRARSSRPRRAPPDGGRAGTQTADWEHRRARATLLPQCALSRRQGGTRGSPRRTPARGLLSLLNVCGPSWHRRAPGRLFLSVSKTHKQLQSSSSEYRANSPESPLPRRQLCMLFRHPQTVFPTHAHTRSWADEPPSVP